MSDAVSAPFKTKLRHYQIFLLFAEVHRHM